MRSALLAITLLLAGCQSAYYASMEQVGVHKREILIDRVEAARDGQHAASEQLDDALQRYRKAVEMPRAAADERYRILNIGYLESEKTAEILRKRIAAMDDVASALFAEWEAELKQYSSASLRMQSASSLRHTRQEYAELKSRMLAAQQHIQPVLRLLQDQLLYLRHNQNASALTTLRNQYHNLQARVEQLQAEMQRAIAEADRFIDSQQAGR